jgi:cell division protein FtsB
MLRWLAVATLVAIALGYVHPLRAYLHSRGQVEQDRAALAQLERQRRSLDARLAVAKSNEFVVREARKLNLVRPGERLFIVTGLPGAERP